MTLCVRSAYRPVFHLYCKVQSIAVATLVQFAANRLEAPTLINRRSGWEIEPEPARGESNQEGESFNEHIWQPLKIARWRSGI